MSFVPDDWPEELSNLGEKLAYAYKYGIPSVEVKTSELWIYMRWMSEVHKVPWEDVLEKVLTALETDMLQSGIVHYCGIYLQVPISPKPAHPKFYAKQIPADSRHECKRWLRVNFPITKEQTDALDAVAAN